MASKVGLIALFLLLAAACRTPHPTLVCVPATVQLGDVLVPGAICSESPVTVTPDTHARR